MPLFAFKGKNYKKEIPLNGVEFLKIPLNAEGILKIKSFGQKIPLIYS